MDIGQLIKTFTTLAQIDSPTGDEKEVAQKVAELLSEYDLIPSIDKHFNVHASVPGNTGFEPIILNAHLDTVEPGRNIQIIHKDGIISSDGKTIAGIDDKIGVSVILETIRVFHSEGYKNNAPIDLIFTVHEETSTDGPRLLDYSEIKSKKGFSFDAPKPVGTITLASPFYNRFDFFVLGKDTHASQPDQGINALDLTINALSKIKLGTIDEETIRNIRIADAETQVNSLNKFGLTMSVNKVPGGMYGMGEVRSFNEEKVEQFTNEVKNIFEECIEESGKSYSLEFSVVRENGGFKYEETDPFVVQTVKVIEQQGLNPIFYRGFSCYDANVFAEKGIQIINVCLGSEEHHTTRENISVDNLTKLAHLVYALATHSTKEKL